MPAELPADSSLNLPRLKPFMISYLTDFIGTVVNKVNHAPFAGEDKTRFQYYTVFLFVGITTMVIFGILNLLRGEYTLCLFILMSAVGLFAGWLFLMHIPDGRIVYRINICIFGVLIVYMLMMGGEGGSKSLWINVFPLIAFFLFGNKEGVFWSGLIFLIVTILFWMPFKLNLTYAYDGQFKIRFLTVYLIISAVTYWFEYYRHHYYQDLDAKNRILRQEKERLKQEIGRRSVLEDELKQLANTDSLTGVMNRRHFWDVAARELDRHRRYDHNLALLIMDIDNFKQINDKFGHPTGDKVIQMLARRCLKNIRNADYIARIGGEEFAILLVETDPNQVFSISERLRKMLAEKAVAANKEDVQFTVSIGVATNDPKDSTVDQLFQRADEALYTAKNGGRNRVEFFSTDLCKKTA